jgi:hypothetical protein
MTAGVSFWIASSNTGIPATVGQVMISALPIILGFQLILAFLNYDVSKEPKRPISF